MSRLCRAKQYAFCFREFLRVIAAREQVPVQLNEGWRVSEDDLQWILQRWCSKPGQKAKWAGRSFCRTREALLRCVNDHCGVVCAEALKRLEALSEWHD